MLAYIYALVDVREPESYKYIGWSLNPSKRISGHLEEARGGKRTHKCNWIRKILEEGFVPSVVIIDECHESQWADYEKYWIWKARLDGHKLTNATDGGEGMIGFVPTAATRRKLSIAGIGNKSRTGQKLGAAEREKIGNALRGRKLSKEQILGMSERGRSRKFSESSKRKMKENHIGFSGHKHTEATKLAMSRNNAGRNKSASWCAAIAAGNRGRRHSDIHKLKISLGLLINRQRTLMGIFTELARHAQPAS